MTAAGARGGRREQIDGLRVIAMTGVLYVHYWNEHPTLESVRVSLFFIVSGFLIGVILLSAKDSGATVKVANFYIRRALRLLPALFLMLAVAALFNMDRIRESLPWHLFQMSSLYFAMNASWKPWIVANLWSLNIVEQFYLAAPLIILLLTRRQICVAYCIIFAISAIARTYHDQLGLSAWSSIVFAFDPVAAGVILAMAKDNIDVRAVLTSKLNNLASVAIIASPFLIGFEFGRSEGYRLLCIYALSSIVLSSYIGYRGVSARLLANPLTRFLSRVSYATYVYHLVLWWLVAEQWPMFYEKGPLTFLVMSAVTVLVATVSWHVMERHFDALKAWFPVTPQAPRAGEPAPAVAHLIKPAAPVAGNVASVPASPTPATATAVSRVPEREPRAYHSA
ncbi:acyltransferase [Ensifer sp.]|jgi:peptidoglycan/LPS O-acetylase OafA/YrhL|uniref:acyltransferase family protein n=1 Tax=Ensifer sp. TaxID=1872086 RepID=UPI002E0DA8B8|nr:acyltransferase [Ensifer sp.]